MGARAEEAVDTDHQRRVLVFVQQGAADQIVVPDADAAADGAGRGDRGQQRQEHAGVDAQRRTPVNVGRFLQFARQALHEAREQKRRKRHVPRRLDQDTAPDGVVGAKARGLYGQREQTADERDDHQRDEHAVVAAEKLAADPGDGKAGQRRADDDDDQRRERDGDRVRQRLPVFHLVDNVGEVFEREQLFCQEQRIFDDILAVFECAEHQIVDRHQHDDRAQSEHQLFDKRVEFLLFFHQKISSLLRSTTS